MVLHLKGDAPFVIPFFIPYAGCPHRCVFCNQVAISGQAAGHWYAEGEVTRQVDAYLGYRRDRSQPVQLAFYGGNFLGLAKERLHQLLTTARKLVEAGRVDSIRFSTRPDTIERGRLDMIADYPVATVELGVQSLDDRVLARSKRGHAAEDTERAVALLQGENYEVGLQVMAGLPGDDGRAAVKTANGICRLAPDFVRIYPTVVLAGSALAEWYRSGRYHPLSIEQAVAVVKQMAVLFLSAGIPIVRMGLQASEALADQSVVLAGPYHPAFGHLVYSALFLDAVSAALFRKKPEADVLVLRVHPKSQAKMRGLRNGNLEILKQRFCLKRILVQADESLSRDEVEIDGEVFTVCGSTLQPPLHCPQPVGAPS